MKKTIKLAEIVRKANKFFSCSPNEQTKERNAVYNFVSHLLHDQGVYQGFYYLSQDQLNDHTLIPGVKKDYEGKFIQVDSSRINFYFDKL